MNYYSATGAAGLLRLARKASVQLRTLRGSYPLLNMVRRACYGLGPVEVADFDGDLRFTLNLGEHMASQIFWFGYYSGEIARLMKQLLRPGDIFIDGGANIGELSLVAAKSVGPGGRVLSFEPAAGTYGSLVNHVRINGMEQTILAFRKGLSDQIGSREIFSADTHYRDGSLHTGLVTMFRSDQRGASLGEIELTTIDAIARDVLLDRLAGVKLDIEGAELAAIRGASDTLARFRPWLIVEIGAETCHAAGYDPAEVLEALPGYRFLRIEYRRSPVPIRPSDLRHWQNVLCLPK